MKNLFLYAVLFIFANIQLNWSHFFNSSLSPQILFIAIVFLSLFLKGKTTLGLIIFCGLLVDIFYAGIFGLNLMLYIAWYFLLKKIKSHIYKESLFVIAAIIFLGVWINFSALAIFNHNFSLKMVFINSLLSSALSFVIIYILKKLCSFLKIKLSYR